MSKKHFTTLWYLFSALAVSAQMVTTDPALPTMGKLIKIYYDTSKDAGDLHNFTGDLYVHTGVTINGVNWQNVIGTWAVNSTQPRLTYLGNYIYELDITPDIRSFFSLPVSSVATKICLVFRNSSGSLQTRPDIFIDIFESGINATFTLPEKSSLIAELNETIPVKAAATGSDSITLYVNNNYLISGTSPDQVTYSFTADQYGEFWVKAVAWDKPSFSADSFFVYVRRPVVTESLPAGMKEL
jgi:hypothetical protein